MAGGPAFTDRELVEMVTTTPARMLGWGDALGDLSVGKRADLFVLAGHTQDPYAQLLAADEGDVRLVAINGVPRVGTPTLMRALGTVTETETITVGGSTRVLNLHEATADPTVEQVTLAEATQRLTHALKTLPQQPPASARLAAADPNSAKLAIDGLVTTRMTNRPHLPYRGQPTGPQRQRAALVAPAELTAIDLDPLTTVDDPHYYTTLSHEQNLQADIRAGLAAHAPHTHS